MKILHLFLLLLLSGVNAQYYLWPTNSGFYLTSTFCEFRTDHYHSGIDIKTWNKEGYPCYAIEDGYIDRIRVSPFGYGKVIYLRLKDGNIAVYAHLQRFTKKIDRIIRKKQIKNQKYRIVWRPKKKYKVKKGDIIGYTGSTGIGTPHLHFEIRDNNDNPLNPLQYYKNNINDNIPPVLQKISIIPVSVNSTVNKSYLPRTYSLEYLKDGIYIIKEPLYIRGDVGLAIKLFDQAFGLYNKFSFYRVTLKVAGEETFQISYDKLNFDKTRYINSAIDYQAWSNDSEVFYKLYIEPYNILDFYRKDIRSNGIIKMPDVPLSFSIYVMDYHGNMSVVKGEMIPDIDKSIKINRFTFNNSRVELHFISDPVNKLEFAASKDGMNWTNIDNFIIKNRQVNSVQEYSVDVLLPDSSYNYIQLGAESDFRNVIQKNIYLNNDSLRYEEYNDIQPVLHVSGDRLIFSVDQFYYDNELRIMPYDTILHTEYIYDGCYQTQIPEKVIHTDSLRLELRSRDQTLWSDSYKLWKFIRGERNSHCWHDSSLIITSNKKSFFYTSFLTAKFIPDESIKQIVPVTGEIVRIIPEDLPLYGSITMKIKVDSLPGGMNWAIYNIDRDQELSYIGNKFDTTRMQFSANIRSLGDYVLAADTVLPEIHIESPVSGNVFTEDPVVRFSITDSISGIGDEDDISILIDGKFVLPEWDPEKDLVVARFDESLAIGRHTLEITVSDRAGNTKKEYIYFTIL